MASNSQVQSYLIPDKGPGTNHQHLSAKDREILQRPYAKAVLYDINRPDLVLRAIARLQTKAGPVQLSGEDVLRETDRLLELEQMGGSFVDQDKHLGSDGDSDDGNSSNDGEDHVKIDGPEPVLPPGRTMHQSAEELDPAHEKLNHNTNSDAQACGSQAQKRRLQELLKENKRLKKMQRCLECTQNSVSITFLPCGHCSYCYECGKKYDACPICHKTILADVKTFLG